ncbi:hypothetical protein ASD37_25630 [Mycobacterium sp. Root135]|uniref:helix-turn-helix domain-containing protein n=1 Tax=Mycobacterium sp. Root135 TaxID=1736457 RepID=UPI0006F3C3CE|nr:helix-turn-helix domain-containing protein [Mycobacterium sp. Root135]KQY02932.1 hypothetical protein ASD37_25630 [Mycobacterium sp. Root135]
MSIHTYGIAQAAVLMNCSPRWLVEQLRANRFRGRKVGRQWLMTEQDIADALDLCANDGPRGVTQAVTGRTRVPVASLTPTSRKRLVGL